MKFDYNSLFFVLLLCLCCDPSCQYGESANWEITGTVNCGKHDLATQTTTYNPVQGATVALWERDRFNKDDHLSEDADAVTNDRGFFTVKGTETELGLFEARLEPYLLIKHTCANAYKPLTGSCVYETRINLKPFDAEDLYPPDQEKQYLKIDLGDVEFVGREQPGKGVELLTIDTNIECP